MQNDGHFDAKVAATYDRDHGATSPELLTATVSFLERLAEGGPALEFAIGTGRVALPLAARGLTVKGIELSAAMFAQMQQKPGGADIETVIGDMTTEKVDGSFGLVFLVFNTIDNLTSQAAQVACFRNAARHLRPGGRFVIETQVPPVQSIPFGETKRAFDVSDSHWGVEEIDIATQRHISHHIWIEDGVHRKLSVPFRYAWPAEMDLMAELAGMTPEARYGGWGNEPFTKDCKSHVSVWRKPV